MCNECATGGPSEGRRSHFSPFIWVEKRKPYAYITGVTERLCRLCERDYGSSDSCVADKWQVPAPAIPYGLESDLKQSADAEGWAFKERCHDCGVTLGRYHHPGCDVEQCPVCQGQAFGCKCLSGRLPYGVDEYSPWADAYAQADVIALTGAKRSQIENWTRNGWLRTNPGTPGTGHHRSFPFVALVEAAIAVRLAALHIPLASLLRELDGPATLCNLFPNYRAFLSRSDADLEAEYVRGLEPETPATIVATFNADRTPGQKRLTEKAYLHEKVTMWRTHMASLQSAWEGFRDPKTRPAGAYFGLVVAVPAPGRYLVTHHTARGGREGERAGSDTELVINVGEMLENLERATGDRWREAAKTGADGDT